jgi:hypothetical protein
LPSENAPDISAAQPIRSRKVRSVTHQTARVGDFAGVIDRGPCVTRHQLGELVPSDKNNIRVDHETVDPLLGNIDVVDAEL